MAMSFATPSLIVLRSRLELLERATADWQQNEYGEVKGL
jgi:hypothetical protein